MQSMNWPQLRHFGKLVAHIFEQKEAEETEIGSIFAPLSFAPGMINLTRDWAVSVH
jgi:hypothetical protein